MRVDYSLIRDILKDYSLGTQHSLNTADPVISRLISLCVDAGFISKLNVITDLGLETFNQIQDDDRWKRTVEYVHSKVESCPFDILIKVYKGMQFPAL